MKKLYTIRDLKWSKKTENLYRCTIGITQYSCVRQDDEWLGFVDGILIVGPYKKIKTCKDNLSHRHRKMVLAYLEILAQ